jgi:hypothetical protein
MKAARVEIGSLVVHQPQGAAVPHHASLGRMVEAHLKRLIVQHGAPEESRQAQAAWISGHGRNSQINLAAAIARELYRSIQGKG